MIKPKIGWKSILTPLSVGILIGGSVVGIATAIPGKPLVDINDGILIAILVALGGFLAQLYLRLGKLEDRIGTLETAKSEALDKLAAAASFINRVGFWVARGCVGPMPQPPEQIRAHIDAELWESDAPGGTD